MSPDETPDAIAALWGTDQPYVRTVEVEVENEGVGKDEGSSDENKTRARTPHLNARGVTEETSDVGSDVAGVEEFLRVLDEDVRPLETRALLETFEKLVHEIRQSLRRAFPRGIHGYPRVGDRVLSRRLLSRQRDLFSRLRSRLLYLYPTSRAPSFSITRKLRWARASYLRQFFVWNFKYFEGRNVHF